VVRRAHAERRRNANANFNTALVRASIVHDIGAPRPDSADTSRDLAATRHPRAEAEQWKIDRWILAAALRRKMVRKAARSIEADEGKSLNSGNKKAGSKKIRLSLFGSAD
jgi:hypothetical protein